MFDKTYSKTGETDFHHLGSTSARSSLDNNSVFSSNMSSHSNRSSISNGIPFLSEWNDPFKVNESLWSKQESKEPVKSDHIWGDQSRPSTLWTDKGLGFFNRRHSYAANGDNQWLDSFNSLNLPSSTTANQTIPTTTKLPEPHEETETRVSATEKLFAQAEKYFSETHASKLHITGKSAIDLPAALEALSASETQLPRFPGNSLPGVHLVLVAFKGGRVDVFYLPENCDISLKVGSLVIVEADRGRDLGKVTELGVSIDEARLLKLRQYQQQQSALAVESGVQSGGTANPPALHFPKPITRFATSSEISQLLTKEADEEKARRVCALKVKAHGLTMGVVDAEYQWDRRKLTFYYSASHRIDFRELVKDLFRIYKTRIWMCAVNGDALADEFCEYSSPRKFSLPEETLLLRKVI